MNHSSLLLAIESNVKKSPQKIAIISDGEEISYAKLWDKSLRAAHILDDLGIKTGDSILLSAKKNVEYLYLYLGAQVIGVINVLVDSDQNEKRLDYIEQEVHPKFCFGYIAKNTPSKLFSELDFENAPAEPIVVSGLTSNSIAEILFTTGTTGNPKGVCLSYANIFGAACNINSFIQNTSEDIEILCLPVCHSFGMGRIRCNLIMGATIILVGNFANVRLFVNTIEKYKVTGFGVVPAAWAYVRKISGKRLEKYANQLHYIEIGSAAMSIENKREMLEMFPNTRICMHYGLTEASRSSFIEFHDEEHLKSIGKPVSNFVTIKIFDHDGEEMPIGEIGEICVSGNMVMKCYLREEDSQSAYWGEYFRTGDNGYIDADGYIYLLGREKELINVGGKKVSPIEIEDTIISIGVGDCVCVPTKDPKGILGEVVKCYVVKGSTTLSFQEISELLVNKLEAYKRPVEYEWIDMIPMTASGKKQRLLLKESGPIKIRTQNGLYYRTFQELRDNVDLGYSDPYGIMASLDNNQREAILNNPVCYNDEDCCQILYIDHNTVVGTQMCFPAQAIIDGEVIRCNHASTVYSHPDYRSKGIGGDLLMALTKLPPLRNTITGGNSQMSISLFKALRYNTFEFPRFIFLEDSRCAIEYVLHTKGRLTRMLASIVNCFLKLHKFVVQGQISRYAKGLTIEYCQECPQEVENIVAEDSRRFRENHDKSWFDWNLKYSFNNDNRNSKGLYVVKDRDEIVAFFVNKIQYFETASARGFKNVLLGSVMEWGIKSTAKITERDIQLLAIKTMPIGLDGVQVASDNKKVIKSFKRLGFFPMGKANFCSRLRSIQDNEVQMSMGDAKNWRLRLACNDTLIN